MSESREGVNADTLGTPGKRVILVNGIPASGKSSLAVALSAKTGWLPLSLDGIKNPFLQRIEGVDRAFNRKLGQASYQVIWSIVADAPQGSTFIVDAWFGFQPKEVLSDYLTQAGVTQILEIWCQVSAETAAARYEARLGERVAGHLGAEYIPELKILAGKAQPMELGPVYYSNQEFPVDINAIKGWIDNNLTR
ncbi:AAA family ATPase [Rouxiella badensis]|jgi:chloramphenicol 3-O-phosphotransferase|uniref:AAA family ATPase n=1 Tax=Rouxiella badensis TaxID=1646377 RepID=UPI001B746626|nr:AAA family ATPase [Rouxiella badensis]MCC3702798.1 AAA family ATPase [Rouxiella badensis]MCC3720428.1 AAA family ATPase [Rouxiella badensis]MCC3730267.1 AAA family ATPase [Rouxiella badensis]MCC3741711.1 AAA family ATPase [Rouxiella badensis]MCC3748288.1 AAA family ATPase [Rouxiella badensis]